MELNGINNRTHTGLCSYSNITKFKTVHLGQYYPIGAHHFVRTPRHLAPRLAHAAANVSTPVHRSAPVLLRLCGFLTSFPGFRSAHMLVMLCYDLLTAFCSRPRPS